MSMETFSSESISERAVERILLLIWRLGFSEGGEHMATLRERVLQNGLAGDSKPLEGQVFFYFGAAWCPDCVPVTSTVRAECEALAGEAPFTLLYISSDTSAEQMQA